MQKLITAAVVAHSMVVAGGMTSASAHASLTKCPIKTNQAFTVK